MLREDFTTYIFMV